MSKTFEGLCVQTSSNLIEFKDFAIESKCLREVIRFTESGVLLLKLRENSLQETIEAMLKQDNELLDIASVSPSFFTDERNVLLHNVFHGLNFDPCPHTQSWLCLTCKLPSIARRKVMIASLNNPINTVFNLNQISFVILILIPMDAKATKSENEIAAIFASLFADSSFRQSLIAVDSEDRFRQLMVKRAQSLAELNATEKSEELKFNLKFCDGLKKDFLRRLKHYKSDFVDAFDGVKNFRKTLATTFFLYFAIILPCIAFGVRAGNETRGAFDSRKALIGQTIGGLIFATFSGQPLVIIMTTAPLCLYTKVIFDISLENEWNFRAMYTCVALWTALLLIIYSVFDFSKVMHFCTKSTEEIFAVFSFFAFAVDAIKDVVISFKTHYGFEVCQSNASNDSITILMSIDEEMSQCKPEISLLYFILVVGTVSMAISLYNLNQTSFFISTIRETISDYALPIAVLSMSFKASVIFRRISVDRFKFTEFLEITPSNLEELSFAAIAISLLLAVPLSLLFFMDQNISAAMVNNRANKLKKGPAYHLDLLVVALLNVIISNLGFPLMHGMLPHSPLHARSLADIETREHNGHKYEIVTKARETRVAVISAHIMIGLTAVFLIPYPLAYIPVPVLDGLFIYCAFASLRGNEMVERTSLFITEQRYYPSTNYLKKCEQKSVHYFTVAQIIQTAFLCFSAFSSSAYFRMSYPVIIAALIPIRHYILPKLINKVDLNNLDSTTGDY